MNDVQIIKRAALPAITSIEEGGEVHLLGELRDFSWSDQIKSFLGPGSGFSASWVQLAHGEVLKPHTHPVLSMMVFYAGSGQVIGDLSQSLEGDEVVVVPAGCLHGFVGGPRGLYALSIQFARGLYSTPERPRVVFSRDDESLARLLEQSERRAEAFQARPAFELLGSAAAAQPARRRALFDALRVWLDGMESISVSRYASCNDPTFQHVFRKHLLTFIEPGRERSGRADRAPDPALEALTSWFSYQMYVLDNAEKMAIVCLVVDKVNALLRNATVHAHGEVLTRELFGTLGGHATGSHTSGTHALGSTMSDSHIAAGPAAPRIAEGVELLAHGTPAMYTRWMALVSEAWDMADAMIDRVAALTLGRANP